MFRSVSYTHLDVYKRQGYDKEIYISKKAPLAPTPEPQTTQNPYKTNVERTAYSIKDFSFLTIDMSMHDIMAVSYTHLNFQKQPMLQG